MLLQDKKIKTEDEFFTFAASDLDLTKMTLSQVHDTPSVHKQCFCKVITSIFFIREICTRHQFCTDRLAYGGTDMAIPI